MSFLDPISAVTSIPRTLPAPSLERVEQYRCWTDFSLWITEHALPAMQLCSDSSYPGVADI